MNEGVLARSAVAAAVLASGMFLVVGMIGISAVPAAAGVGALDEALADSSLAAALVIRAAFRDASIFALGLFLLLFAATAIRWRLSHPVLGVVGVVLAIAAAAFPWVKLPVPPAFAVWFVVTGASLLASGAAHRA